MTKGMRTTVATSDFKDFVARSNALVVQRLLDAGAILLGKTNLPVWCADMQSFNKTYGRTNNPWDLSRTPGGSSGGSAASVACGFAALEMGSDIGGSIRVPAHFCGVCGHKPSYGLGHLHGHLPEANHRYLESASALKGQLVRARRDPSFNYGLAVSGPLARCCADLELAFRIVSPPEPVMAQHGWSFSLPPAKCTDVRALRICAWLEQPGVPVDTEYQELLEAAVRSLEASGASVNWSKRPVLDLIKYLETFWTLIAAIGGPQFSFGDPMTYYEVGNHSIRRNFFKEAWEEFFQDFDVVLMPVLPIPAFPHTELPHDQRVFSGTGTGPMDFRALSFWPALPILADLPVTVVPVGRTKDGLPCGVQIVGSFFQDLTTIEVGKMLEQLHPPSRYEVPPGFGAPLSKL